ncbi:MAG: tetratricopeptide repeat protein, partial [Actinomycetota bacterium]|nr:tetratricopeptide repeat protein [Actinomycetota bacterium]
DELRIVVAGARSDLGQHEQALAVLSTPQLDPSRTGQTAARLFYAYADTLLTLGRGEEALQWFLHAAAADLEGATDAEERITELS